MAQSLFRKEAVEAKHNRWLGRICLAQPVSLWVLSIFSLCAAALVVLFLVFGHYTKRSRVVGQLMPMRGMATVLAPATGVIARIDVTEGGRVEAGQTVAVLTVPRATLSDGDALAAVEARLRRRAQGLKDTRLADQDLLDAQRNGLVEQLTNARRELEKIREEITTRNQQVTLDEEVLERLQRLRSGNYVSELQIKQQRTQVLEQVSNRQALQRQAIGAERSIAQLEQSLRALPVQRQVGEAGLRTALAQLEQEQVETLARGELALTAQVSGVVATQLFKPGQAVEAGQPLMSVLPQDGRLEAGLLVPSRAIGFIDPGDKVLLRYQAYPYQKFGHQEGRVKQISRSALSPVEVAALMDGLGAVSEPMYRVTVSLSRQDILAYGKPEQLKPGMALEADILGERSRLIEWIFEPLYSHGGLSL
ncbi:HlyD family efflux transporter periplasmic adaptor subunit [Xanthomonas sp. AmX2]|uniref:HlyD family secretion protein n=1 Tax=Xanthomonas sp. TaxID=29446 RepID=UPI001981911E|nr:HlyD family efflux transporter periplasmic adaptor subunit [Xanthomonas sp.]MBN6150790.1 HlyD family efflux transporter periplasmic adaptor subunit [Xanthomonas sp.]